MLCRICEVQIQPQKNLAQGRPSINLAPLHPRALRPLPPPPHPGPCPPLEALPAPSPYPLPSALTHATPTPSLLLHRRRAGELASDDTDEALRGVNADRGLHSSCTCFDASGLVNTGPSSTPPLPPPLPPPLAPCLTTGDLTASRRILESDGGGRPANVRLFGEPGSTVTGCPKDDTETSSEDIIEGGGEDVWLCVCVVAVVADTPINPDPLSVSSPSPPPPPAPRKPRRLAPQPPSAPPPLSSPRSRL